MLDHALEAVAMTKGKIRADLDEDRQLNLALVRLLEIIGEAATRIPKEDQACYADISWQRSSACATVSFTDMTRLISIFFGKS